MADHIKLCTFNVNGLGQDCKRQSIFKRLSKQNSIVLLQETHSTPHIEKKWRDEWHGQIEFSHFTSSSAGVAILLPPSLDITIKHIDKDNNGRLLLVHITYNNTEYIVVNVYAPVRSKQKDQLDFIQILKEKLSIFTDQTLLVGGDFNFYMSQQLDKIDAISNTNDNELYREEILHMLDTHG